MIHGSNDDDAAGTNLRKGADHTMAVVNIAAPGSLTAELAHPPKFSEYNPNWPRRLTRGKIPVPASKTETRNSQPRASRLALDRYRDALRNLPPSGGGGCHVALLGVANLGRRAGVAREQIAQDLANQVHGSRKVTHKEIAEAVAKAFNTSPTFTPRFTARPAVDCAKLLDKIMERGAGFTEADLWTASPVRIDWPPELDGIEALRRLFAREEQLFVGARHETGAGYVLPASEWIARFERGIAIPAHIIPNPLTGQRGHTKADKPSFRADSCVARFKYAVVEFDMMSREQQIHFWAGVKLPIVALLDSGGKSVHGWIRIDAPNAGEWTRRVEHKLFALLTAVGADGACKNEARLSRMPGHFRAETGHWQRLLYLDPVGKPVLP